MERSREQLKSDMQKRLAGDEIAAQALRNQITDFVDSFAMNTDIAVLGELIAEVQAQLDQVAQLAQRVSAMAAAAAQAALPGPAPELQGHIHITNTSCPMVLSLLDGNPLVSASGIQPEEQLVITLLFTGATVIDVRGAAFRVNEGDWREGVFTVRAGDNVVVHTRSAATPGTSKRVDVISDIGTVAWMITTAQT